MQAVNQSIYRLNDDANCRAEQREQSQNVASTRAHPFALSLSESFSLSATIATTGTSPPFAARSVSTNEGIASTKPLITTWPVSSLGSTIEQNSPVGRKDGRRQERIREIAFCSRPVVVARADETRQEGRGRTGWHRSGRRVVVRARLPQQHRSRWSRLRPLRRDPATPSSLPQLQRLWRPRSRF